MAKQKQKQNSGQSQSAGPAYKLTRRQKLERFLPIFNKACVGLAVIAGIGYVASVNDLAVKGFVLQKLKLEAAGLAKENKITELQATQLGSLENIEKKAKEMRMVKVDKVEYIIVGVEGMAKK